MKRYGMYFTGLTANQRAKLELYIRQSLPTGHNYVVAKGSDTNSFSNL